MDLLMTKLMSGLVIWITSLVFGLTIPFFMRKKRRKTSGHEPLENETLLPSEEERGEEDENINPIPVHSHSTSRWSSFKMYVRRHKHAICRYDLTSLVNCVCGGLFLGICFLELLPECRVGVNKVFTKAEINTSLPATEFLICVGLLLVMLIEQLVTNVCAGQREPHDRDYDVISERPQRHSLVVRSANSPLPEHSGIEGRSVPAAFVSSDESFQEEHVRINARGRNQHQPLDPVEVQIEQCSDQEDVPDTNTADATRTVVLIAMLSLHSIFEGLALGLEATVNNLVQLFVAIVVHKCVLAFSLGLKLFDTFSPGRVFVAVVCMGIFSTGSPLGCAIGTVMSLPTTNTTSPLTPTLSTTTTHAPFLFYEQALVRVPGTLIASAILECLATGTFLYVTFVEVIPLEFRHASDSDVIVEGRASPSINRSEKVAIKPIAKFLVLLCGFAAVSGLQFV